MQLRDEERTRLPGGILILKGSDAFHGSLGRTELFVAGNSLHGALAASSIRHRGQGTTARSRWGTDRRLNAEFFGSEQ